MINRQALELYLYMGSSDKVIEILKKEGVKTREQAISTLSPYVRGLVVSSICLGGSLAGAANGSEKILNAFPSSRNNKIVVKKKLKKKLIKRK